MNDAVQPRQQIGRLREQAEAATPGPWRLDECGTERFGARVETVDGLAWVAVTGSVEEVAVDPQCETDARHIARYSPSVVLALLDDWTRRLDRDEATLEAHAICVRHELTCTHVGETT